MTRIRGRSGSGSGSGTSSAHESESASEGEVSRDSPELGGSGFVSSVSRLSSRAAGVGGMEEDKLRRYKTVLCARMSAPEGCKYGVHCDLSIQHHTRHHPPALNQALFSVVCCPLSPFPALLVLCCVVLCYAGPPPSAPLHVLLVRCAVLAAPIPRTSCAVLSTQWRTRPCCAL